MRNLWRLTVNILKVNFRKRSMLGTFFLLPVLGMLLSIGANWNNFNTPTRIGVIDNDQNRLAKELIRSLGAGDRFKIIMMRQDELKRKIVAGDADCVVIIPAGFTAGIYKQHAPQINLVSVKGQAVTAWFKNYLQALVENLLDIGAAAGGSQTVFRKIYHRYQQAQLSFQVVKVRDQTGNKMMTVQSIGFLILFMMVGVGSSVEMILKEKRNRTYYRIRSAPVTARTYIAGHVLANLLMVIIQIPLALLVLIKVLGVITFVPFGWLLIILIPFGLVAIGLGLLIVTFSKDTAQAGILQNLLFTPTCLLAGCFWPDEIMPRAIQCFAAFLPQHWALTAIQRLQDGDSLGQVWMHVVIIFAFALTFFLIAAYRISRDGDLKTFV